ncbi:scavenger receptor cysteine-rich domain-containing protein DMBT1-like [Ptychodera flava]|uniref:scavenger receptor cysteine-rich domain-containing protein DMBT1-like n=1 Tax=Ptychodera flava TaxID=63121 RepID=UPI00396AA856
MFACSTASVFKIMEFLVFLILAIKITEQTYSTAQEIARLANGSTPYEGRVEILTGEYGWTPVCDEHWDMSDADVLCRDIGYRNGAMSSDSPRTSDVTLSTICVVNVTCNAGSTTLRECSYNISTDCNNCYQAKATCNFYGYHGCYHFSTCNNNIWTGHDNMTIQYCVELCRNNDSSVAMLFGEFGSECICRDLNSTCAEWSNVSNAQCNKLCSGSDWLACGGGHSLASVYDIQMGACGGEYQQQTGTIYSPYFPGYYNTEHHCEWTIEIPEEYTISIKFTIFNLANNFDNVKVTETYQGEERLLGNFAKHSPPTDDIHSCSNVGLIRFQSSDGENTNGTFAFDFSGRIRCDNHSEVENGEIITDSDCPYYTDDIAAVVCNPGYETNSSHQSIECRDGIWNDTLPQCVEKIQTTHSVLSIPTSEDFTSIGPKTTPRASETSELSIGLIVGVTIGIIGFVLSVVVLTLLVIRRRRKAGLRNKDDACSSVEFVQDTVHTGSTGRENHQYETIDRDRMIGKARQINSYISITPDSIPLETNQAEIVRNDQSQAYFNDSCYEICDRQTDVEANLPESSQSGFIDYAYAYYASINDRR